MDAYQKELKRKRDNYSHDQYILEQGEHKKAVEIATSLKKEGLSIELIAKSTGLSIDEIENL